MVGVLEITFTAFYPRKQHSAVWQNLSIIRLYDRGHVHITLAAVTPDGRRASDPFPHLGCGGGEGRKWGSRDPKEDGMDSERKKEQHI